MNRSPLFTPPRLFSTVHFHRHTDRSIGWLELFYDLVYVATLIQIGNFLSDNVTLVGFGQFLVLMAVVWWSWSGATFYQNRYVVDDVVHRVLLFSQMFAVATLGISVSKAFDDLYIQFTLAYVAIRLLLVLMYVRSARAHPESAELSRGYITGFSIGAAIWLLSILLPREIHWVGWLVAIAIELSVPLFPRIRALQREVPLDVPHVSERFGIFTLIVLGESFIKVLDDAQGSLLAVSGLIFSVSGLTVLNALWWLYFNDTAGRMMNFTRRISPFLWIYGHLPLAAALIAFGVGAKKLFAAAAEHPEDPLNPSYRLLYTVSVVLYLLALAIIDLGMGEDKGQSRLSRQVLIHIISAVVVAVIGVVATDLNAVVFVTLIAVVMMAQVIYDIVQERRLQGAS